MSYGIDYGHFSENIHIGRLNKAGTEFVTKEDHTIPAALAVAAWVTNAHGGEVDLTPTNGGSGFRITVERIDSTT
jgi:L-serine deaminase